MSGVKGTNNDTENDNAETQSAQKKTREIPRFARNDGIELRIRAARSGKRYCLWETHWLEGLLACERYV